MNLLPTKTQWRNWSLPNKLTCIGTYSGIIFGIIGVVFYLWPLAVTTPKPISYGGNGGDSYVAGDGVAYGAAGGSTEPGGIGGNGGHAFVGGNGMAYGGRGGNAGTNDNYPSPPTPADIGLPEQFWGYGQPGGDGLIVLQMGNEGNTSTPLTTIIFTPSNMYSYSNTIPPLKNPLTEIKTARERAQQGGAGYPPQGVGSPDP